MLIKHFILIYYLSEELHLSEEFGLKYPNFIHENGGWEKYIENDHYTNNFESKNVKNS